MAKNDDWSVIVGALLGIAGAVAIAQMLSTKKCPRCNKRNPNSNAYCEQCGWRLP